MRAYICGKLSTNQNCFLPASLWFATPDCEYNIELSDKCIRIDGLEIESAVNECEFSCRWKGVELCYINCDGEYIESEDFTVEQFKNILEEKNMSLANMDAYFDSSVNVTVTQFTLVDPESSLKLEFDDIEEMEFIGDDADEFLYMNIKNGENGINVVADN